MEEEVFEQKKRGRGRPRKNPGDPVKHYKPRQGGPLSSTHEYIQFLPDRSLNISEEHFNKFFETMLERQLIWKRRFVDKTEQPWTDDEIFRENKFPNLYRELDRSTQYLINKVIIAHKDSTLNNLVWKILVYRLFNNPETFKLASFVWKGGIPDYENFEAEKDKYAEFMGLIQAMGANPFTNAYIVSSSFAKGLPRADAYTTISLPELHKTINKIIDMSMLAECPEDIIHILKLIPGVKDFVAHELYNDLLYINKFTDYKPITFDINDFVNVGPGSLLGIRLIYPSLTSKQEQVAHMHVLLNKAKEMLEGLEAEGKEKMPYAQYDKDKNGYVLIEDFNLTVNNIEGWLCEYSKYWKLSIEVGKKQRKFEQTSNSDCYDELK